MRNRPMKIFEYAFEHPDGTLAVTDEGERILYGDLKETSERIGDIVGHRLAFVLCRNTPGSLLGYLGLLSSGAVPLLLDADLAPQLLQDLMDTYHPAFCLVPGDLSAQAMDVIGKNFAGKTEPGVCAQGAEASDAAGTVSGRTVTGQETVSRAQQAAAAMKIRDYVLYKMVEEGTDPAPAPELRLLLTTSGSTGSQKLVRISGENLDANAEFIIEYLQITRDERPITVLPMQYSYGMSIIHTHVMVGAPIILTRYTLMEREFWERVQKERVTSLCGVPYTFEMYSRLGLMDMDLPDLHYITQAGGKLPEKRHMEFARWCADRGIRFYVMYGQTEASPRMGWLPPDKAIEKCGSMGISIPGGRIDLIDENGEVISGPANSADSAASADQNAGGAPVPAAVRGSANSGDDGMSPVGELVYTGPNVALGYALCAADLAKGDEFHGCLHTGDMARRDADGYLYIVGRRSRFIKMAGKRVGLDEVERILRAQLPDTDLACAGRDDALHVYIEDPEADAGAGPVADESDRAENICMLLRDMTGISDRRITVFTVREIPRSSSGKIRYADLK